MEFHHIGLAVRNIQTYYEEYLKGLFGFSEMSEIYINEAQNVKYAFIKNSQNVTIELLEPISESSPAHTILERKRGGLYHLCFSTQEFNEDLKKLRARKFVLLSKKGRLAFLMAPTYEVYELMDVSPE